MLNRATLIGRLTRDPELRYTQSGIAVANFSLAVGRNYKNKEGNYEADYIEIVAWKGAAELCANSLFKGHMVAIEGRIQSRSFEDKDGNKRNKVEVVLETVQFLQKKKASDGDSGNAETEEYGADDIPF